MKIKQYGLKFGLSVAAVLSLLASVSLQANAATKPAVTTETHTGKGELVQQTFKKGPLSIQFRYINNNLEFLSIKNTSKTPVKVYINDDEYLLGANDEIAVTPPRIKYVHVTFLPYTQLENVFQVVMPKRFGTTYVFKLPQRQEKPAH